MTTQEMTETAKDEIVPIKQDITQTEDVPCIQVLEKIYDGDYHLLPVFAQSFITFLYSDMPQSDDPRVFAHHIATKGAYVLGRAVEFSKAEEEKLEAPKPSIWRDLLCIICGIALGKAYKSYMSWLGIAFLVRGTHEYHRLSNSTQSIVWCIHMILIAYHLNEEFFHHSL